MTNENKRTDYPGSEIAYLIQNKWDKNFVNKITVIVGDEWFGGNLSYHLNSRPKQLRALDNNLKKIEQLLRGDNIATYGFEKKGVQVNME